MVYSVQSGFCFDIHRAKPSRFECFGTFVNLVKGVICFGMCGYILRKMFKNHRRALAGYTKNTISIDVHMSLMFMVGLWSVAWGATKMFDVTNSQSINDLKDREVRLLAFSVSFCYGISSLCEILIVLLLCSRSIGKNDFARSLALGTCWSLATFVGLAMIVVVLPGDETTYMLSRHMFVGIIIRNSITFMIGAFCIVFYYVTKSDRLSILTFSTYLCPMFLVTVVSQGMVLSDSFIAINFGICMVDICEILHFVIFPAICYFSLKRDCQYWSIGVDEDEETSMLGYANELTWSEMPNYQDFVIPKTELFYRSTLVETVDMSVEIHLWRRKLACVKRFKFDLLTRDNIKYFKGEANIFKTLSHENIVHFYGILIDPPSLGIVMQFCKNSDVFKQIEGKRQAFRDAKASEEPSVVSVLNPLSVKGDSAKDKDDHGVKHLSKWAKYLSIMDDHVVHSVTCNEEELQDMSRASDDGLDRDEAWHSGSSRFASLRMPVHSRISLVMAVRQYETKDTFEPMLVALQVCRGMAYLHSQGITHRDMKSLNVLLDDKFNAQIADFGESSFGEITSSGGGLKMDEMGTPGWAAPELLLGQGVSKASDVFSFGIILWELLTFRAPSVLITLEMLQIPSVASLPSTHNHPLLKLHKSQNVDRGDKHSVASTSSGFVGFFDRIHGQTQQPAAAPASAAASASTVCSLVTQDHDLTMIEISDLRTARVLMCELQLRPPMPCNLPTPLSNILTACWSASESRRPSFADIYCDLEKMLVNQEFDRMDLPCSVEAAVNMCRDRADTKSGCMDNQPNEV